PRPADDPRRARDRARDRGVARVLEAPEHLPRAAAVAARRGRPAAHDLQPNGRRDGPLVDLEPEPAGDPDPNRARPRDPLRVRRRPVPELRASNRQTRSLGERLAVNFVMQGSNADIIKVAMIAIRRRLREEGRAARLVLQIHDELLLEAPENEVAAVKDLVREEMCGAYELDPPLAVD